MVRASLGRSRSIEATQAIAILQLLHTEDATAEVAAAPAGVDQQEVEAGERYFSRRPNFNFKEMGIPVGALLNSTTQSVEVTVRDERRVLLNDEEMSLTAATKQVLGLNYAVAPGPYWRYQGRLLKEIYDETYPIE